MATYHDPDPQGDREYVWDEDEVEWVADRHLFWRTADRAPFRTDQPEKLRALLAGVTEHTLTEGNHTLVVSWSETDPGEVRLSGYGANEPDELWLGQESLTDILLPLLRPGTRWIWRAVYNGYEGLSAGFCELSETGLRMWSLDGLLDAMVGVVTCDGR